MKTDAFPAPFRTTTTTRRRPVGEVIAGYARRSRIVWEMFFGWGPGERAVSEGRAALRELTGGRRLGEARIPVAVTATDLESGRRHIIRTGNAIDALYASSALAGVLPPLRLDGKMLADGAYSDIAPIDVARAYGHPVVIAVDPGQSLVPTDVRNGYQAVMRAMEICHMRHADARFAEADLVLRPAFRRTIDTLDFDARRECVAAGAIAVRRHRPDLVRLLADQRECTPRGTVPERHPAVGLNFRSMNSGNHRED
jgi:NTE family protein